MTVNWVENDSNLNTDDSSDDSTEDIGTDSSSETASAATGQGTRPDDWANFGAPCQINDQCTGYHEDARCIHSVMSVIDVPDGYCAACCNEPGKDICAQGIDCVGLNEAYLICLAHCDSVEDCRDDGKWDCLPLPYTMDQLFPGTFCLPTAEYAGPDTDDTDDHDPGCDWPWLEE